jgi:hypothetical protein
LPLPAIGEFLQISKCDAGRRLPYPQAKSRYVDAISADGMFRAAVEPDIDELVVASAY